MKAEPGLFEAKRKQIARRARNQKAPYNNIVAVEASTTLPFAEGLKRERELFEELENSDESRALRYAFFAEREAMRVPGTGKAVPVRKDDTMAAAGPGTGGGVTAMTCAAHGPGRKATVAGTERVGQVAHGRRH